MSDKVLKTRVKMKNDTPENWEKATNFSPLEGEVVVYNYSVPKVKIGDGETLIENLPFITDECLQVDITDAEQGEAVLINADSLGGVLASNYALKSELKQNIARLDFNCVLSVDGWSSIAPYEQRITVEGISSYDKPILYLDLSEATEDNVDNLEINWTKIKYSETAYNEIIFYCIKEKPTVDLSVYGYVIRSTGSADGEVYQDATGVEF